jgi:3-isopropylmalate dehydrogenase
VPETKRRRVVLLPGDGIGPEVVAEAAKVLDAVTRQAGVLLEFQEHPVGGAAIESVSEPLPRSTFEAARAAEAVLLGAVGSPKHDSLPPERRPERALLGLRGGLGVFANLRPVRLHPALLGASPLRPEVVGGTDLLIVRELTGGIYFGTPRGVAGAGEERRARNTMTYSVPEIRRIARVAFEAARARRKKVTSVDKANILEVSQLWREVVIDTARAYPDVACEHLYVDNAAMQLVARPKDFDVILTDNMFGDILSDEASVVTGSLGLLPSASIGDGGPGVFEPVHGSAPDIAGQGIANPLAMFLSAALMLRHGLGRQAEASAVESAVDRALDEGLRTRDLGGTAGTAEATQAVLAHLD